MTAALKWLKKTEWKTGVYVGGKQIAGVNVAHWSFQTDGESKRDAYDRVQTGANNWNVYAWIYPEHPLFEKLSAHTSGDDGESYALTSDMPLHGGQTFFTLHHAAGGKVTSVQIGCDYMHHMDDRFNEYATREEAREVFADAEELHAWLLERATSGAAQ